MYVPEDDRNRFYSVGDWQLQSVLGKGSFATGEAPFVSYVSDSVAQIFIGCLSSDVHKNASKAVICISCL